MFLEAVDVLGLLRGAIASLVNNEVKMSVRLRW